MLRVKDFTPYHNVDFLLPTGTRVLTLSCFVPFLFYWTGISRTARREAEQAAPEICLWFYCWSDSFLHTIPPFRFTWDRLSVPNPVGGCLREHTAPRDTVHHLLVNTEVVKLPLFNVWLQIPVDVLTNDCKKGGSS